MNATDLPPTEHRDGGPTHHVVVGAGPVGSAVARLLAARGELVTVVSRRGNGPSESGITLARGDATDAGALERLVRSQGRPGALFNCANPEYHRWPVDWPPLHRALLEAAARTGAVLVMTDNLYAFGPAAPMPMVESAPMLATGPKGATRRMMATELLEAHAAGRIRGTLARASDYLGPEVLGSAMGDRVVPRVIAGKAVQVLGDPDAPHHIAYVPDVARTLVTIAADERAWGRPWHVPHAPALSQRDTIAALAGAAGTSVKVSTVPGIGLWFAGLFSADIRELRETKYQFERPWIVDSTLTEQTFGLRATPLGEQAEATVAWFRARGG